MGGILLDAKALDRVRAVMGAEDFYDARRRTIFQAMLTLSTEGKPIDSVTLHDRLRDEERLSDIGIATYLAELSDRVPSAAYIDSYARIVRNKATRRRLIRIAVDLNERCHTGEDASLEALFAEAERVFRDVTAEPGQFHEEAGDAWPLEEPPPRPWLIQGWLPVGRITLLSGKRSQGKSCLTLQLAAALASGDQIWLPGAPAQLEPRDPVPVVFCSWEDERDEIARKLYHMKRAESVGNRLRFVHPAGAVWGPAKSSSRYATTLGELTDTGRRVRAYCQQKQAQLLILDPLAAAYTCNENDRALVRAFMADWNRWAQETGCTVLIIAHPPKTGADTSGSTDWEAAPRAVWTFGLEDTGTGEDNKKKSAPRLACIKSSYARVPPPLWLSSPQWPLWEAKDATNAAVDWETFTKNRATPEAVALARAEATPMRLDEARSLREILEALSRFRWYATHNDDPATRENCPPEQIAQADDPALASFWDTTAQARRTFQILTRQTMKVAAAYVEKQPTALPDEATRVAWFRLSMQHISDVGSTEADALQEIGRAPVLDETQPFDAEQAYADAHLVWLWLPREWREDVPHPLAEIVAWWQNRPTQIERDTRDYGIVPQPFAVVRDLQSEQGSLFEDLPATTGLHTDTQPDLFAALPAVGKPLSSCGIVPLSTPLVLYDAAGGQANRPRKGTPLALRLWVEAILSVKIGDRNQPVRLIVELRDLINALWPKGWNGPARDAPRLEQAFNQIGRMFVPWEKGRWLAVVVRNRPHYSDMRSPVVFDVELPPGSDRGATVYRPMIRKYGVKNAWAFRLSLSIPGLWNERLTYPGRQRKDGRRGGRRIPPLVPEVRRNAAGGVLGVDGRPLTDTRGKPVTHWSDPRADRTGKEQRNPELAKRLPWLTPDDLLEAGAAYTDRQTPEARRKALERTRKAGRIMAANNDLVIVENGHLWRLEPPDWWGNPDGSRRKS